MIQFNIGHPFKFSSPQKPSGNFGNEHKWIYGSTKQNYFG